MQRYFFLILCLFFTNPWAQINNPSIDARLSQTVITFGQTVTLQITASNGANLDNLDFSILEQDFVVGGISRQQRMEIINGNVRNERSVSIPLRPKRLGTLTIPSFSVGNLQTPALSLEVEAQATGKAATSSNAEYWLEMTLDQKKDFYVQEHIPITLRLFTRIPLQQVTVTPPLVETTVTHKIGSDRLYNQTIDQKNYQVLEQKFIIIPERSGKLLLPPANLSALDMRQTSPSTRNYNPFANDPFFNDPFFSALRLPMPGFPQGLPIAAVSNSLEINILPIPVLQDAGTWLPAENVSIRWQNPPPATITVGQPVTLTLEVRAEGASSAQLPEIALPKVSGLGIYPGKITQEDQSDGQKIIGVRTISFTIIGQRPGEFILPSIGLRYWQPSSQKTLGAAVPISGIQVLGNSSLTESSDNQQIMKISSSFWWGTLTMILLLSVIGSFFWWLQKNQSAARMIKTMPGEKANEPHNGKKSATVNHGRAVSREKPKIIKDENKANQLKNKAIKQEDWHECLAACARNDAKAAAQALLAATGFSSLLALADALAEPCPALHSLHAALYHAQPWQGEALAGCLQKGLNWRKNQEQTNSLLPFYPE
jgi:hypothetical protein